jgi:hypothetical protein
VTPRRMSATVAVSSKSKYLMNAAGLYVCPHCGETKARQNTMFYHIKKHTGTLDYPCTEPGCGKAFVQKSGLVQHRLQAHPAPDRVMWGCPSCDHTCPVKANMVIHIGRMHGAPRIPGVATSGCVDCSGCSKTLASPTAYYYHAVSCFELGLEPTTASKATVAASETE